jgi:Tfp pilus assembly protein PilO
MKKLDIYYIYWVLGKFTKALGLWGLIGIAIIVACFMFYLAKIETLDQEIKAAQSELDYTKKESTVLVTAQVAPIQTSTQEINEFYRRFPAGASLPKWLSLIDGIAIKQHLILNRGDYKLSQTKQGQLLRYEIVLPLVGKYTQVRQFIALALLKLPALALSDLQIRRENSLSPTVEARLVFVLFLKGDSW